MIKLFSSYFITSGLPSNISVNWNFGSILGLCLAIQIASGVSLGMHYNANINLSFDLVEYIMRDINYGWFIRYLHSNGASMFFLFVYLHIARGLYAGSYTYPRVKLWNIGVVIYILMMGKIFALNVLFNLSLDLNMEIIPFIMPKIRANKRIGPHNIDILSIIYGTLLGDGTLYNVKGNIRLRVEQKNQDYLYYLFRLIKSLGYCNTLPFKNKRGTYYFYTYTYTSLIFIYNDFYKNNIKVVPKNIELYLTPLALAIWIMDDGAVQTSGLNLCTHSFTYSDNLRLCEILQSKYNLKVSIIKGGFSKDGLTPQYRIRISKYSMKDLYEIVKPYMCPSMMYKLKIKLNKI